MVLLLQEIRSIIIQVESYSIGVLVDEVYIPAENLANEDVAFWQSNKYSVSSGIW